MKRRIVKFQRARSLALAVGVALVGSLALASPSFASAPTTGTNCQPDGKVSGRGSTLQLELINKLIGSYASDVCGPVAADPLNTASPPGTLQSQNGYTADPTDPSDPAYPGDKGSGSTYGGDWSLAYDYPAAQSNGGTGSGQGRQAISCRTDAFGGTDIPYTEADILKMSGGAPGKEGGCNGSASSAFAPFEGPSYGASLTNAAVTSPLMSFPVGGSAIALPINLTAADCGGTAPSNVQLSVQDVSDIFGGIETTWSNLDTNHTLTNTNGGGTIQVNDAGENPSLANCNVAITRVVRQDTSGTTQGFLNFLNDAGGPTTLTCYASTPSQATSGLNVNTNTWGAMSTQVINTTGNNNNTWPGEQNPSASPAFSTPTGCTNVVHNATKGAPYLLQTLEATDGGIGYADVSDVKLDANAGSLITPTVEAYQDSSGATGQTTYYTGMNAQSPTSGSASNCTFAGLNPPGTNSALMGLNGDWSIDYNQPSGGGPNVYDDAAWANQGPSYPVCSLTWDMTYSGEDGNSTAQPTAKTGAAQTLGATLALLGNAANPGGGLPSGIPESGNATITHSGTAVGTIAYTGVTDQLQVGTTRTYSLTGVTGFTGSVPSGSMVTFTSAPVLPDPQMNADQRRNLYSFFTYVFSAAAQTTAIGNYYASLPVSEINSLRAAFQQYW